MRAATAAKVSGGKVDVSGRPPASEITSGRAVTDMMSRIAEDRITRVRAANSPAYRSRSREVDREGGFGIGLTDPSSPRVPGTLAPRRSGACRRLSSPRPAYRPAGLGIL